MIIDISKEAYEYIKSSWESDIESFFDSPVVGEYDMFETVSEEIEYYQRLGREFNFPDLWEYVKHNSFVNDLDIKRVLELLKEDSERDID